MLCCNSAARHNVLKGQKMNAKFNPAATTLTSEGLRALAEIAKVGIARRGVDFYSWRNAPKIKDGVLTHTEGWGESATTRPITIEEGLAICQAKLDGAYGERFALSVATAAAAAKGGALVHLIQKQAEKGVPFDANGWLILAVNGHPLFHISPDDMSGEDAKELVLLVGDETPAAEYFGWKGTDKVAELSMLIDLMV